MSFELAFYVDSSNNEYSVSESKTDTIYYYKNNKYHRDDGPAIIHYDGSEAWYFNGVRHREDGPAIYNSFSGEAWYYHGEQIHCSNNEEFLKIIKMKAFI